MPRSRPLATLGLWLFCASLLTVSATAQDQTAPTLQVQITRHEQKLAAAREAQHLNDEAAELNTLGSLYRQVGQRQKGVDYCNQALMIESSSGDSNGQALSLMTLGRIYTDLGQEQKALDLLNQALPIWRELGDRLDEATTLTDMGRVYNNLGQRQDALKVLNQSLPIMGDLKSQDGEADALQNIATAYSYMGRGMEALDYYNQSLPLWRAAGDRGGEALTLGNMAIVYDNLGEKQKSLESYQLALAAWREIGNRPGEARALNYMGRAYSDLGQKHMALALYNQALPIWRDVKNPNGEALALNDIGRAYEDLGQNQKALDFLSQALPLWRQVGNRRGEAVTLTNLGRARSALGQKSEALEIDNQSLIAWRAVEDRRGQAFALGSIGAVYSDLKQYEKALPMKIAALSLAKTAGDPDQQGWMDTSLMIDFRDQRQPEEAIFFGMEAVNAFQQERRNIAGLDQDLQAGFAQSKSETYRQLAELLVQADRLGEAEHVLDLLKEQELKEVVRGAADDPAAKVEPVALSDAQQQAQGQLATPEQEALAPTDVSVQYAELAAKATRTPEETARMKDLETKIEMQNSEVSDFFKEDAVSGTGAARWRPGCQRGTEQREVGREPLAEYAGGIGAACAGHTAAARRAARVCHCGHGTGAQEVRACGDAGGELRRKVLQARDDLRNPTSDPKPHLAELYAMVVGPFAGELSALERTPQKQISVPTLLWSLDGVMRYLPMGALYDGQHYMVERFNNILFTPESYGHMTVTPGAGKTALRVLAVGLSKSYGGLPALPGVLPELDSVVHDPAVPESHGPMDGVLLPNERFTYAALQTELGAGMIFPVVHVAGHFVLESGSGEEPYLMLGGYNAGDPQGYQLTLSKLEDSTISFHGTRLLTLSACSTAKGDVAEDGLEMDSLGMIAQQKDAEAVMVTLWDVNDASTSRIMSDFCDRWVKNPADGKAEALRNAQLALLRGSTAAAPHGTDYSHPFYWAPFVLIGNYR